MKLFTSCQDCQEKIPIKSNTKTRSDLERKKSTSFMVDCPHCGNTTSYHVNDINATVRPLALLGGFILGLFLMAILGLFIGRLSLLGMGAGLLVWKNEEKKVSHFNQGMLSKE